jgi:hypothetical protein
VKRLAMFLALVLATGCAQEGLTLLSESDLPEEIYGPPQPTPDEPIEIPANGTVYFVSGRHLEPATVKLQPVLDSLEEALLVVLFQGPQEEGLSSEIPEGSRLNGVDVTGGLATVDVSGDFEHAAAPRSQALRIAQVVYTLTEVETGITSVRFEIDGVPQQAIGGEQLGTIPGPVTRADYERFRPRREDRARDA